MAQTLLSSKVVIQEEEPQLRQIAGVPTAITGFVGVTEKGPIGSAVLVQSPAEYRRVYGGHVVNGDVAQAIDGFFQNGGKQAYISRVVHLTDPANTATKTSAKATQTLLTGATAPSAGFSEASLAEPYTLVHGATLVVTVDGGAPATATFNATAASRASAAETWDLSGGKTLLVAIDGGAVQTINFIDANFAVPTAATAEEVAAVINGQLVGGKATVTGGGTTVTISSDRLGTSSSVNVSGGTANAGLLAFTTGIINGGGNVANVAAVTVAEVETVVEAAVAGCAVTNVAGKARITSNTTGGGSSILVGATSTADTLMGFDNASHVGSTGAAVNTLQTDGKWDGAYANGLSTRIADATSGETARFNLQVLKAGVVLETWTNLSMDDADPLYIETVINHPDTGSEYIAVVDLDANTTAAGQRPANGTFTMAGGSDGLGSLNDADFIGASGATRSGMRCLDLVPDLSLLCIPGRATSAVHNAMLSYCETTRNMSVFAILDPPAATTASGMVTYVETTAAILNFSEFGAIYWPRVKVLNPNKTVFGNADQMTVPPSGYVAGVCARNDAAREGGVYDAPAGTEQGILQGVLGFETDECLDEDKRDLVYPKRINPLTTGPGLPRYIDGSRTLKANGNFPSVSERRGVTFIEQSVKGGLQFARHKNNDETLRARVDRTVRDFLVIQMKNRAFRSQDPKKAFTVDFGDGLNPPAQQFAGKLIGRVGLATQKPAEFIIVKFSQDTRAFTEGNA